MASSRCLWIAVAVLALVTRDVGVYGRAVDRPGFVSRKNAALRTEESSLRTVETALRTEESFLRTMETALRTVETALRTGESSLRTDTQQEQCAELVATWLENTQQPPEDNGTLLQLRVRPFQPGAAPGRAAVFPGKSLFSFVRRVYRCCRVGVNCRRVKGIQGRLRGGTEVEFLLTREISQLTVTRAELHLQVSNPERLAVRPLLASMAKRDLPTRYSWWSRGSSLELQVDLLFLFQNLHPPAGAAAPRPGPGPGLEHMRRVESSSRGGPPTGGSLQDTDGDVWGDGVLSKLPTLDLGLILDCSGSGSRSRVSCGSGGVRLLHTPFMVLDYR